MGLEPATNGFTILDYSSFLTEGPIGHALDISFENWTSSIISLTNYLCRVSNFVANGHASDPALCACLTDVANGQVSFSWRIFTQW